MGAMTTYWELRGRALVWSGVLDRSLMTDSQFQAQSYLADMAAKGNWPRVMEYLDPGSGLTDVNQWRPGGKSWTTLLHEAARLGASREVVCWLLDRGALRSQTDAEGRTALDVAEQHGQQPDLLDLLAPPPSPLDTERIQLLDSHMSDVVDRFLQPAFAGQDLRKVFRYPPVGVLHEVSGSELWMQLPPSSGGLRVTLQRGFIELLLGYRDLGGSALDVRTWGFVVTHRGAKCVYEGFASTPSDPDMGVGIKDAGVLLKWRQASSWWQADKVDPSSRKVIGDSPTYRIYGGDSGYWLWEWPGPQQGAGTWAKRLSRHDELGDAMHVAAVREAAAAPAASEDPTSAMLRPDEAEPT